MNYVIVFNILTGFFHSGLNLFSKHSKNNLFISKVSFFENYSEKSFSIIKLHNINLTCINCKLNFNYETETAILNLVTDGML